MASRKIYYTTTQPSFGHSGSSTYDRYISKSTLCNGSLFDPEIGDIVAYKWAYGITYYAVTAITYDTEVDDDGYIIDHLDPPTVWLSGIANSGQSYISISVINDHTLKIS